MLILRGKRLGFSLRDISDYLSLYDADRTQTAQVQLLVEMVDKRLKLLEDQMTDLQTTLGELREIRKLAAERVAQGVALDLPSAESFADPIVMDSRLLLHDRLPCSRGGQRGVFDETLSGFCLDGGEAWRARRDDALLAGCMIVSEAELVADSEGAQILPAKAYLTGYDEDGAEHLEGERRRRRRR